MAISNRRTIFQAQFILGAACIGMLKVKHVQRTEGEEIMRQHLQISLQEAVSENGGYPKKVMLMMEKHVEKLLYDQQYLPIFDRPNCYWLIETAYRQLLILLQNNCALLLAYWNGVPAIVDPASKQRRIRMNKKQNTFPDVCSLLFRPMMFQIAFCSELNPSFSILQILILVSLNRFRPPRFLQCVGLDKTHCRL